jgi:serine/threonine protein kinase
MRQIGPYTVEEEIGRGGMATVYRVRDQRGDVYALKLLHQGPSQDKRWGTRFRREFRLLSRLKHTHLINVHDYDEDEFQAYYVMDYIDGTNLWKFYREHLRGKTVHERLVWLVPLISQIVSALDYIHHHRVIHKDLKPANILLQHNGENAYLVDFGLARELKDSAQYTSPGFMGTLGYSPPEMIDRGRLDGRADIYSLGVILYTLLADRRPIQVEGRSFDQLIRSIREEAPIPLQQLLPDIHPGVAKMVHRCIQKDPADRYRNTRELWQELLPLIEFYQGTHSQQAPSETPPTLPAAHDLPLESPDTTMIRQAALLVESELIGRQQEVSLVQARWRALSDQGKGSLLVFFGLPGIGKTYFLEEVERNIQRQSGLVYHIRLRPNMPPYAGLAELVRPLISHIHPSMHESQELMLLGQYLPTLQDMLPPPTIKAGPLNQPVTQLTNLLLSLSLYLPSDLRTTYLIDNIHELDYNSREIFVRFAYHLLSPDYPSILFIGTASYQPDTENLPLRLPEHKDIEQHHLQPLSEEEESLFVSKLLGRAPEPSELQEIRNLTRGLPLRTFELVHQGSLLAQSPFSPSGGGRPTSDEVLSSVSTAIHDLSSLHDMLRQSVMTSADQPFDPAESTMLVTPSSTASVAATVATDAFLDPNKQTTQPELTPITAQPKKKKPSPIANLDRLRKAIKGTEPIPTRPTQGTIPMDTFRPDSTMLQPMDPAALARLHTPPNQEDNTALSEETRIQELPPVWKILQKSSSHDNLPIPPKVEPTQEAAPGEQTMLQSKGNILPPPPTTQVTPKKRKHDAFSTLDMKAAPLLAQTEEERSKQTPPPVDGHQLEEQRFAESSEELILVPLLHKRLAMLDPNQRMQFSVTAFFPESFTYEEFREAIQSTTDETLDLLNVLLSLRLLSAEISMEEEFYSYLHPVLHRILLAGLPTTRHPEFSLRAALAMAQVRPDYHRHNNASYLAMRFAEGEDIEQALYWQQLATLEALSAGRIDMLDQAHQQLIHLLESWEEDDKAFLVEESLSQWPDWLAQLDTPLKRVGSQLMFVGVLHFLKEKEKLAEQSTAARLQLRSLLKSEDYDFEDTMGLLQPLLQFARLRVRKKK